MDTAKEALRSSRTTMGLQDSARRTERSEEPWCKNLIRPYLLVAVLIKGIALQCSVAYHLVGLSRGAFQDAAEVNC